MKVGQKDGPRLAAAMEQLKKRLGEEGYFIFPVCVRRYRHHREHMILFPKDRDLPVLSIYPKPAPKGPKRQKKIFVHHYGPTIRFKKMMVEIKQDPLLAEFVRYAPLQISSKRHGRVRWERYLNNEQRDELATLM